MKCLVYAFYPNLGIPIRVVDFKSKRKMIEYINGLRMTDTPYVVQDVSDKDNPLMVEVEYAGLGKKKMIEMLTEWTVGKKNE